MDDRLYRSRHDRVFSGVCGGLGERFDVDPALVRLGWIVVGILTGVFPLLVIYVLMAIVVPEEPPGFVESFAPPPPGTAASAAWRVARETERAARREARRARRTESRDREMGMIAGIVLVAIGGAILLDQWFRIAWSVVWPGALIVIGAAIIVGAVRR